MKHDSRSGYVALTSAIIVLALMLMIVVALSLAGFLGMAGISGAYYKEISLALSRACADSALLKLVQNGSYAGNESVAVGTDACTIAPIVINGNQKILYTQASFQNSVTKLKITVNTVDLSLAGWEEE